MDKDKFEEIVRQLKIALNYEKTLETEILIKQHDLDEIREQKTKLIIAIANKDLYQRLFEEDTMTSKENIELIKQLYEYAMYDFHCGKLDEMTEKDKAVGKAIEQIEKDLEVLEILRKNIDVDLLKANEKAPIVVTILRCKPLTNTIDKEYQKVKEWLKQ